MRRFAHMGWPTWLGTEASMRVGSMLCWCGLVGMVTWVVMQWLVPAPQVAPMVSDHASAKFQMDQSAEARLLGVESEGGATPPAVKLVGLFADTHGRGAAVISVEGQPALSKAVGDEVANGWILAEVGATQAVLERHGLRHTVDLPIQKADPNMLVRIPAATAQ